MEILIFVLGLVLGLVLAFVYRKIRKTESIGVLRVDTSDPDGPYLFLELHTGIGEVMRRKRVILDVQTENYISRR